MLELEKHLWVFQIAPIVVAVLALILIIGKILFDICN